MNKRLVIIPARGGSKGIPQKNTRFLVEKPLIAYAIANAKKIADADVYVSTEDDIISELSVILGAKVIKRPIELAADEATVDEVAYHALSTVENGEVYETVITMQPTSPLLSEQTLLRALQGFDSDAIDTLISVHEKRHLMWERVGDSYKPLYEARVNRQQLEPVFEENGAFVICRADYLRANQTRISPRVGVYPVTEDEGIDIDTKNDWSMCDNILRQRNIAMVVKGSVEFGMGHIERSMVLNNGLANHNVFFYSIESAPLGIKRLESLNHKVVTYKDVDELSGLLKRDGIDIVVNDILDTDSRYVLDLKSRGMFVVNFEDNGPGAAVADMVFNGLYEWSGSIDNSFFGYRYTTLRQDIYLYPIKRSVKPTVENLLIGFGGTDVKNATLQMLRILEPMDLGSTQITLVLGIGYRFMDELESFIDSSHLKNRVTILRNIPIISPYLHAADLVISGNGRMVYETIALGTPAFVCSQNERETSHIFPRICKGIQYLGYVESLNEDQIHESLQLALTSSSFRTQMNRDLVPYAREIRKGLNRVCSLILESAEDAERDESA
jgi:CMP-N-acetylneuraminic acid synthetase/spore coat polysaccharide biosynthesis predicted glycosyltransferase SpsG